MPLAATMPIGSTASVTPHLQVFYAVRDDRWAFGFSAEWVRAALEPRPKGERLTDGEDFKAVFARLDARPSDLTYVNLPKVREYVVGSQVIRMVLQGNAGFREFVNRFFTREAMSVGLGSTSVRLEDGVRTTNFGPPWMSGTAVSSGFIAALALPNLLAAIDRGRTRRTVSDLKAIAQERLAWLDGLIEGRAWICGDRFTLADILLFAFLDFGKAVGQTLDPKLASLPGWLERVSKRPSAEATA